MSAPAGRAIVALSRSAMTGLPWYRTRRKIEDAMPTDLTVILGHRPGELTRLGGDLRKGVAGAGLAG